MTMDAVEKYKDRERFYLPGPSTIVVVLTLSLPFLHHKTQTLEESITQFADAAFITNDCVEWIKFQVATTLVLTKHLSVSVLTG